MSNQMTQDVAYVIHRHVVENLLRQKSLSLPEDAPLIGDGYLTSLQAVALVAFLEERFNIEILPEEVDEENFSTLARISALVGRKLG